MPAPHDSGYKLLFSDPLMVRDLVQGFMFAPPLKEDALFRLMSTGFAHLPAFGGALA